MAQFSVTIHYETSKVAVANAEPFEIADDRDPRDSVMSVTGKLLRNALDQGALDVRCPITIELKRL